MGLAPVLVEQIFSIISGLKTRGLTILLIEQNANAALAIADRGYVIETGRIVMSGLGRQLLDDPRVRNAYLGI
jgi:branched-chain amino acid transport system ATP-binding protein